MNNNKFLKIPEFPGGKEAYRKYIKENLVYPKEALNKRVEGIVYILAEINDNGNVEDITVEKGIGYGCDEESVRLIKNIHFGAVKNRRVRLKAKKRFRIEFKLSLSPKINYSITQKDKEQKTAEINYLYSIQLKKYI